ncbi:MAG: carboxypeptidase regulatory-like domain-containing protein, partial [Candidatus Eisenbacteria sp.]|nr:carboxypeptidase regulatory-like domain-containing protein [Candidatus Eisenbacteria bacterium]
TNTLTLDGVNTYTLAQIYTADVGGGWGVVTKVGEMYLFMCHMVVGDAGGNATKLVDSNVGFQLGVTGTRKNFESKAGSSFEMTGCILKFWSLARKTSYGTWKFKNCSVYARESGSICLYMRGNQDHERSEFDVVYWYNRDGTVSFYKCLVQNSSQFYYYTSGTIEDLRVTGNAMTYFANPIFKNTTIVGQYSFGEAGLHATFVNSTWGSLSFPAANNYLLDKWEFDLTVTNEANAVIVGATVTLKDKDGVTRHTGTTNANGKVGTWEVLANRYDGTSETKTEYTPFTLTVSKSGTNYLTYIKKFDLAEKIDWKIAMVDMSDLIEDLDDIKGTGFV